MAATSAAWVAAVLLAGACGADADNGSTSQTSSEVAMTAERQRLIIGPERVPCDAGSGPSECLQVRRAETEPWELFYDQIEGLDPEVGTTYVVIVDVEPIDDPPADGSSLAYRLVEIEETS